MSKSRIILLILLSLLFVSCNQSGLSYKTIHVVIPQHPWEQDGNIKLWYYLKWNDKGQIETLYIDQNTREADIRIPRDCTVFICAYPLGEMLPFGSAVLPTDTKNEVELNQSDGYIAHLLINTDLEIIGHVNFTKLMEEIYSKTDDVRQVDDSALLAAVLNGRLSKNSIKIRNRFLVDDLPIPSGTWVSECSFDGSLFITENHTGELEFSPGVYRYYCVETDREFRVTVGLGGDVFHSLRYGMIGL